MIACIEDLAKELGCKATEPSVQKALFKATECGISSSLTTHGISLCGYAEGADAECVPYEMYYPFTIDDFWFAVAEADDDGIQLWNEWNDVDS